MPTHRNCAESISGAIGLERIPETTRFYAENIRRMQLQHAARPIGSAVNNIMDKIKCFYSLSYCAAAYIVGPIYTAPIRHLRGSLH